MTRKQWLDFRIGRENDRRFKLTEDQKEEIIHRYKKGDIGMRPLAKEYGVNRTTICNVVKPERYKRALAERKRKKVWLKYYDKDKNTKYMQNFRQHIRQLNT